MARPSELPTDPAQAAATVLAHAESRSPTLGAGRLVCVDGLAGAGKTTLAAAIGQARPDAVVIATDEMLEGWGGLPGLGASIEALLRPLAASRPGRWRRWDWYADRWAEWQEISPGSLLVLEGVGSVGSSYAELVTTVVWVEAPADDRRHRWLDREGDARHFESWAADEAALHQREGARERADLVLRT